MSESTNTGENDITPAKKSGTVLWLTLILLAGLAGGGYYLWHSLNRQLQQQLQQIEQLQQQTTALSSSSQSHEQQLSDHSKQAQTLQDMAQHAIDLGNRHQKAWLLAESEYLMRMASRRLHIARDIEGAIAALQGADESLHETADLSLIKVRQQLAKDLATLKALKQADIDGIALKLDEMSNLVADLQFKPVQDIVKEQLPDQQDTSEPASSSLSDRIIDTIMSLGDIRIHHRGVKSASEQLHYQGAHLLLDHLASARLAVLRFDTRQFVYDTDKARQLLNRHYDAHDNRVTRMIEELDALARVDLAPELPDISASWQMLQTARSKSVETSK